MGSEADLSFGLSAGECNAHPAASSETLDEIRRQQLHEILLFLVHQTGTLFISFEGNIKLRLLLTFLQKYSKSIVAGFVPLINCFVYYICIVYYT